MEKQENERSSDYLVRVQAKASLNAGSQFSAPASDVAPLVQHELPENIGSPARRPQRWRIWLGLGSGLGFFVLLFLTVCLIAIVLTVWVVYQAVISLVYASSMNSAHGPNGVDVQVRNVHKDARRGYLLADMGEGPRILPAIHDGDRLPQDDPNHDLQADRVLEGCEWVIRERYGILTQDKDGQWRLWWVKGDNMSIVNGKPTIRIPDAPPEIVTEEEVIRRFGVPTKEPVLEKRKP
jgi:hypothetical protein